MRSRAHSAPSVTNMNKPHPLARAGLSTHEEARRGTDDELPAIRPEGGRACAPTPALPSPSRAIGAHDDECGGTRGGRVTKLKLNHSVLRLAQETAATPISDPDRQSRQEGKESDPLSTFAIPPPPKA